MNSLFDQLAMRRVDGAGFDQAVQQADNALVAVYFWGENCYNCEQFKRAAALQADALRNLKLHWLHADVYADPELGKRFGLHGVPTFIFFHHSKRLGRVTGWQGLPEFARAVAGLRERIGAA